jgi:phage terminase large subunit
LANFCEGLEHKVLFPTNPKVRTKWFQVKNGIDIVEVALRNQTLTINSGCKKTISQLNEYAWDDKGEPDKKSCDPHLLDALRYAFIRGYIYYSKERVTNYGI